MGIDINTINQIGRAIAVGNRNENNRRHPGSRDSKHETWAETNRKAAQNTIALIVLVAVVTIVFKLLGFIGRLSIKVFGPKLGRIINVVGMALLIVIPARSLKMSVDRHTAETAAKADAAEARKADYRKQQNDKVNAYRDKVRAKVKALAERCVDDPMAFTNVLEQFERESDVSWNPDVSGGYVNEKIDRAYESCVEILNVRDEKRIKDYFLTKVEEIKSVANVAMKKLHELKVPDEVSHIEHARDEFAYGRPYGTAFAQAKSEIDADSAQYVAKISNIVSRCEQRVMIGAYIDDRVKELEGLAKLTRADTYYIDAFKLTMVPKSIGGRIDYNSSFEAIKACIDEEYRDAEKKIRSASR